MNEIRKYARMWLENATLPEINTMIVESRLYYDEEVIIRGKFIKGLTNIQLACRINCSVRTVDTKLGNIYDKIARAIEYERQKQMMRW